MSRTRPSFSSARCGADFGLFSFDGGAASAMGGFSPQRGVAAGDFGRRRVHGAGTQQCATESSRRLRTADRGLASRPVVFSRIPPSCASSPVSPWSWSSSPWSALLVALAWDRSERAAQQAEVRVGRTEQPGACPGMAPSRPRITGRSSLHALADHDPHARRLRFRAPARADRPAPRRRTQRLAPARRHRRPPVDRVFRELPGLLDPGDLLVFNDTRVIKARLLGAKASGGAVEALVERVLPGHEVLAHLRASKSPKPGSVVRFVSGDGASLRRRGARPRRARTARCSTCAFPASRWRCCERHGHVPLPPYITHADSAEDERRYQTVFARHPGAVAAPTAALHFDEGVLAALRERGIGLRERDAARRRRHLPAGAHREPRRAPHAQRVVRGRRRRRCDAIERTRAAGGRVVAVGTTTLRALESAALARRTDGRCPRHRHLHHAGLRVPGRRPAGDQLPPAEEHADDAGQRLRRPRAR